MMKLSVAVKLSTHRRGLDWDGHDVITNDRFALLMNHKMILARRQRQILWLHIAELEPTTKSE
jgi:hypothetical protein